MLWPTTEQLTIMEQLKATQMNCLLAYLYDLTAVEENHKSTRKNLGDFFGRTSDISACAMSEVKLIAPVMIFICVYDNRTSMQEDKKQD